MVGLKCLQQEVKRKVSCSENIYRHESCRVLRGLLNIYFNEQVKKVNPMIRVLRTMMIIPGGGHDTERRA